MITTRPQVDYKGLYSQAQAARALGVDRHTIARYVKQGYINVRIRRTDRKIVIPGSEILKAWGSTVL